MGIFDGITNAIGITQAKPEQVQQAAASSGAGFFTGSTMITIEAILLLGLVAYMVWYFIINPSRYKYRINIIERRGENNCVVGFDKGRFKKEKSGLEKFEFLNRRKANMPPPDFRHILSTVKGKAVLFVYKFGEFDYTPIDVKDAMGFVELHPIQSDVRNWAALEHKAVMNKYQDKKNFMEKYGSYVVIFFGLTIILVMWILTLEHTDKAIAAANAVAEKLGEYANHFGQQAVK